MTCAAAQQASILWERLLWEKKAQSIEQVRRVTPAAAFVPAVRVPVAIAGHQHTGDETAVTNQPRPAGTGRSTLHVPVHM